MLYTKLNQKRVNGGEVVNYVGRIKEVKNYCNKVCVVQNSLSQFSILDHKNVMRVYLCFQEEKEESQRPSCTFSFC